MDEKIKIYETLLNEKASLEKECFEYSLDYAREFGEQIEDLFELKLEVVTLKKKIAYCVKKSYQNETIYSSELDRYIDLEILDYQAKLDELIEINRASKEKGTPITFLDVKKIKKLYYQIVHLIHPDLHPELVGNETIEELWDKAVNCYKCNDYRGLVAVYDQVIIIVNAEGDIHIDDIDNKIKQIQDEISEIKDNEPYKYKFILDDEDEIKEIHENLEKEINDYKEYKENLEKELSRFDIVKGHEA